MRCLTIFTGVIARAGISRRVLPRWKEQEKHEDKCAMQGGKLLECARWRSCLWLAQLAHVYSARTRWHTRHGRWMSKHSGEATHTSKPDSCTATMSATATELGKRQRQHRFDESSSLRVQVTQANGRDERDKVPDVMSSRLCHVTSD